MCLGAWRGVPAPPAGVPRGSIRGRNADRPSPKPTDISNQFANIKELNVKAKEYMDEVHMYRDRRNGLNVEVGQIRDERNEVTEKVSL